MAWLRSLVPASALLPTALALAACDPKVATSDDGAAGSDTDAAASSDTEDGPGTQSAGDTEGGDTEGTATEGTTTEGTATEGYDTDGGGGGTTSPGPEPDPAVSCPDEFSAACETDDGQEGTSYCIIVDGDPYWTPCSAEWPECEPGDNLDEGCLGDICYWDGTAFHDWGWEYPNCNTPLVVSFDPGPLAFAPAGAAAFDLSVDGSCQQTDWPAEPWLALDCDGDGAIRDGGELFGNATRMSAGGHPEHGFAALAELDANGDGRIDARDPRFGELVLWSDLDDDRVGAGIELRPLAEASIVSINLGFARRASCDAHGNCGRERAAFEYRTAGGGVAFGEVVDVHLPCR